MSKLILSDYCTGEPIEIDSDDVRCVITSTINKSTYSTVVMKNGARLGVNENAESIEKRLASS